MFNLYLFLVVAQMSFVLIDDAKLRQFLAHSKLFLSFFIKTNGQNICFWTKRRTLFKSCPITLEKAVGWRTTHAEHYDSSS